VAVAVAVKMTVPWLLIFGLEASADHQMHIHGQYSHAQYLFTPPQAEHPPAQINVQTPTQTQAAC
jgi:hypothetical protein